jgi:L-ascorbate metabolism protein UlaG (beta-lactamase superfamily)
MFTLTWLGGAGFVVRAGDTLLAIDPFAGRNLREPLVVLDDLQGVQALLVSHGHFDHSADGPGFARRLEVPLLAPPPVARMLRRRYAEASDWIAEAADEQPHRVGQCWVRPWPSRHMDIEGEAVWGALARTVARSRDKQLTLARLTRLHRRHPEGRCVAWEVEAGKQRLLHLGSLALADQVSYPRPDVLCLPLPDSGQAIEIGVPLVERLQPGQLVLHHFDDAFPPMTHDVALWPFVHEMRRRRPELPVHIPMRGVALDIGHTNGEPA